MRLRRKSKSADQQWFADHDHANAYVRDPQPGELEELARVALPAEVPWAGELPPPTPDVKWRVLVIQGPKRKIVRLLTIQPVAFAEESADQLVTAVPVMLGARVAIA